MKRQQINDVHSLAQYLLEKYSEDGEFPHGDAPLAEGVTIAKRKDLVDGVLEYGIDRALHYAIGKSRTKVIKTAEPDEGVTFYGIAKKGEISTNEEFNKRLRERFHSPAGYIPLTLGHMTKLAMFCTKKELRAWGEKECKIGRTRDRRGKAAIHLSDNIKEEDGLANTASKQAWKVFEEGLGMEA